MQKKITFSRFLKLIYLRLFRINDSPQKIAAGLGLGVFLGILPGTGPIAALFLASIFRFNRASALAGCLITNTWLSLATFLLSVKIGAFIFGLSWQQICQNWALFLKDFHWANLFKLNFLKNIFPVITGYIVIGLLIGLLAYLVILIILVLAKTKKKG